MKSTGLFSLQKMYGFDIVFLVSLIVFGLLGDATMFGFFKNLFSGKKQKVAKSDQQEAKSEHGLKLAKYREDKKIMDEHQAKTIVLRKYPKADIAEISKDYYWTIPCGKDFLCGWERSPRDAWVEAALRILGVSPFARGDE